MCIRTLNTDQLNPLFHTFAEFRSIVNRVVARQSTDWLVANAQISPNVPSRILRMRAVNIPVESPQTYFWIGL